MNNIASTKEIISPCKYYSSPYAFFSNFSAAWKTVKNKVLKLETRQVYIEKGNTSYKVFELGNLDKALKLIPAARQVDSELYEDLKRRNVEFVRCRPVEVPLTDYLKWEIGCYNHNTKMGEKIYFLDMDSWKKHFQDIALHDFMVFDSHIAFIHDYDKSGEIVGGWKTEDAEQIKMLTLIYERIKAVSQDYLSFLREHGI